MRNPLVFGRNKPDPTDRFKLPCVVCGNEVQLAYAEFSNKVECPHCHEQFRPWLERAEPVQHAMQTTELEPTEQTQSTAEPTRDEARRTSLAWMKKNSKNLADLFRLPCKMCGNELRLQRIDLRKIVWCPHCGEDLIVEEREAERVDDNSLSVNVLFPAPPIQDDPDQEDELPVGDRSLHRYLAASADTFIAFIAAIIVAKTLLESLDELVQGVLGVAIFFGYYFLCEGISGTTPGKYLLGLHVITRDGTKPSWKQITIRSLWRLLEVNPLLIGGLPAALAIYGTTTRQRFGDKMAGTYVVLKDI